MSAALGGGGAARGRTGAGCGSAGFGAGLGAGCFTRSTWRRWRFARRRVGRGRAGAGFGAGRAGRVRGCSGAAGDAGSSTLTGCAAAGGRRGGAPLRCGHATTRAMTATTAAARAMLSHLSRSMQGLGAPGTPSPLCYSGRRLPGELDMAAAKPTYDLMLMLDSGAPDEQRSKILADAERLITSNGGEITSKHDWGVRALAF